MTRRFSRSESLLSRLRGSAGTGCDPRRHPIARRMAVAFGVLAACLYCSPLSTAAPPANDNYLASTIIPQVQTTSSQLARFKDVQDTTLASTQPDLFNPDKFGRLLGGAGPEPTTCHGTSYGKTVWYDLHPQIPGGLQIVASGFPTAVTLYQYDPQTAMIARRVQCQVSTDTSNNTLGNSTINDLLLLSELRPRRAYTIQVGGVQSGSLVDAGQLNFSLTFYPDRDADGVYDLSDACPTLPGTGKDGCPPQITLTPRYEYIALGSGLVLKHLLVQPIPGGARVEVRCRRCGLHQVATAGPHANSVSITGFVGRTFPAGAKLEIWVTKGRTRTGIYKYGAIGSYISYTVGSGAFGSRVTRCLLPGSRTPRTRCRR